MKFEAIAKIFLFFLLACFYLNIVCETSDEDDLTIKLIKEANYTVEVHEVLTEDDYILTLHRIPGKSSENSVPVYLQHGLLSSSTDWILTGKNESLVYFLWENGFDIWLGNARGNTYSSKHKNLSTEDPKFWNFTFHELGIYDVPANIKYIKNLTKKKIFYIGHSMGCSSFSIMAIKKPEIAKDVKAMIALAPAPYEFNIKLKHLKYLAQNWQFFSYLADEFGVNNFLPRNFMSDFTSNRICTLPMNVGPTICRKLVHLLEGSNPRNVLTPLIAKSFPSGTSIKLFGHWLQHMKVNEFRQYNYGSEGNMEIYGNSTPPNYDITKIEVPIAVFYSDGDMITDAKDCLHYYDQLPVKLGLYKVGTCKYSHSDFLWGANNTEVINKPILEIFKSLE